MTACRLHYFPESGNSYKLALPVNPEMWISDVAALRAALCAAISNLIALGRIRTYHEKS